jgi:hypothetical protein
MRCLAILTISLALTISAGAQVSDLISVRKPNGRTIRTFARGGFITFIDPAAQWVEGTIQDIRNDSVFISRLDIRTYRTQAGGQLTDTIGAWISGYHYRELTKIRIYDRGRSLVNLAGSALIIGGVGYAVLNLVNGAYLEEPINDPENLQSLGIALGLAGAGVAIKKLFPPNDFTRARHQVLYIRLIPNKSGP